MEAVVYQYGNAVGAMSDVTVERIDGVTRVSGTWRYLDWAIPVPESISPGQCVDNPFV